MAPQVWGVLNAHSQIPVQLPGFAGLSQRSVLFDVAGEQIGVFQKENKKIVHLLTLHGFIDTYTFFKFILVDRVLLSFANVKGSGVSRIIKKLYQ